MSQSVVMHRARAMVRQMVRIGVVAALAACSDDPPTGLRPPLPRSFAFVVSDPVRLAFTAPAPPGSTAAAALQQGDSVTWVSVLAGTAPGGKSAAIRNLTNDFSATADVVDGGFDPVPLLAGVGDSVEVVITDGTGATTRVALVVPARKPPVIVRTVPPKGGTDVPLNSLIRVVVSEPMDPRTLTTGTLRLLRDTAAVAGRVEVSADGLRADVVPDTLLARSTGYTLVVEADAAGLSGDALGQSVAVDFTTADRSTGSAVASVVVTPGSAELAAFDGDSQGFTGQVFYAGGLPLTAMAADSSGAWLQGRTVTWTNSNPSVVRLRIGSTIDSVHVEPVAPGRATITATVDGIRGTAAITVLTATVEPDAATLRIGDTLRVVAKVRDSAGRVQTEWQGYWGSGSRSDVLTYRSVSKDTGLVTALGPGNELVRVVLFTPAGYWAGSAFVRVTIQFGGGAASGRVGARYRANGARSVSAAKGHGEGCVWRSHLRPAELVEP